MQFTRSNALIDHVMNDRRPKVDETWEHRKDKRKVRIAAFDESTVTLLNPTTRRKRTTRIDIFISQYVYVPNPIMIECGECRGCGETQAVCDSCNVDLTEENVEPGTDDCCKKCAAENA